MKLNGGKGKDAAEFPWSLRNHGPIPNTPAPGEDVSLRTCPWRHSKDLKTAKGYRLYHEMYGGVSNSDKDCRCNCRPLDEILKVAKLSHCLEFIENLPNKYNTFIGENGVRLSGGEKQRLSIARAILKKSKIILLDEATSSLDSETEEKIQSALNYLTKDRTTLVIAHRLSTILNSNKIYVIDKGEVIGEGNHEELVKNSDVYKNFYEKQIQKS